jgi:AcrR family transcriptional regulator
MAARKNARPAKDRILDAAERLFARRGYYGVSVRDITAAAKVDVALVSYHFGSKKALLDSVFARRAEVLNQERLALLEELHRRYDGRPPVVEVINAFVGPLILRSSRGGQGWKSYFALMAQVNNSREWSRLMTGQFDVLVRRFIEAIRTSLPDADPREIYWSYHFLTGALTHTFAETGRLDRLSGGLCKSSDLVAVNERFARYMAAGFTELAGGARSGSGTASRRKRAARTG